MAENEVKVTIRGIRRTGMRLLGESDNAAVRDTPLLDVDCLLQYVLKKDRSWLLAYDDTVLSDEQVEQMGQLLKKRQTGLPIAYLTGEKEFYGYSFFVTPAVLIPKPDTELLVERAVELIGERIEEIPNQVRDDNVKVRDDNQKRLTVVDMCTGSGCIAISVLLQLYERFGPEKLSGSLQLIATDISTDALAVARENARRLVPAGIAGCLQFCQGNLWEAIQLPEDQNVAVLLTNPPYVPAAVTTGLLSDGRSEPRLALDGGGDGLDLVRTILEQAPAHMAPGGVMLLETGEYNAEEAARLAEAAGCTGVHIHRDLAGMLRLTEAAFPG
ncbi:MAG: peptide chain release factor N(5)-glutamine methyltransferase [Treponemataceae bacterium]|nr:peptide chain release factor N(5)-glutamine methyltransferase [Treponemataceae bacterium]